jgi:hypothetical protein
MMKKIEFSKAKILTISALWNKIESCLKPME